jgi:uracil-DNA glycosylase
MNDLLTQIRACTLCTPDLPEGPRPVLQCHPKARILVAGQAPGRKVHLSGVPFDDASGDRLRQWMGVTPETFYDPEQIAIVPLGFCYPGTGKSGDLPPRPECVPAWRAQVLAQLKNLRLTLAIGQYALAYHLDVKQQTLTHTVKAWRSFAPALIPLPHPSPRNNIWLRRNPWFSTDLLPHLHQQVAAALAP